MVIEQLAVTELGACLLLTLSTGWLGTRLANRLMSAAVAVYGEAGQVPAMRGAYGCFFVWFALLTLGLLVSVDRSAASTLGWLWFLSLLGLLALVDARTGLLPNELTIVLLVSGLVWRTVTDLGTSLAALPSAEYCWGVVLGWLVPTALNRWHECWRGVTALGQGDARFLAGIGGWLGVHALPAVWLLTCLAMLVYLVAQGVVSRRWQSCVALGPFLAVGASLVMLAQITGG